MMLNTSKDGWVVTFRTLLEREIDAGNSCKVRAYKAELAEVLEGAYYLQSAKKVHTTGYLKQEIERVLSERSLPKCLVSSHDPIKLPGKRQPSFLESVHATLERYEVLEHTEKVFHNFVDALILGGSMAYGPFFNVRGGKEGGSDLDIIATYSSTFFDESRWRDFNSSGLFDAADVKDFFQRSSVYKRLLSEGRADVFSHRFRVSHRDVVVSMHFMPKSYFSDVICTGFHDATGKSQADLVIARDFKAEYVSGREGPLMNLEGRKRRAKTTVHEAEGFIVETPLYAVDDGRLYLGLYYRITLPAFKVFGSVYADSMMNMIREAISQRIAEERRTYGVASFTLAHPRGPIFPLGKYDNL